MRPEEQYAQAVVEELRPDLTLRFVERQPNGEHDFDVLDQDDNRIGVLEVTTLCDEPRFKESRLLYGQRKLARVPRSLCANAWLVSIAEGARLKRVHSELEELLLEAERRGLRAISRHDDASTDLPERLKTLTGVGRASVYDEGPCHHLVQEAHAFWEDEGSVNNALIELLERPDNQRKLRHHMSLPERHLFVSVHLSAKRACQQLMCAEALPSSELPEYLTDLWLVPTHISTEGTLAVWHMRSGAEWERLTLANGFTPSR